jgi:hypothetical protein
MAARDSGAGNLAANVAGADQSYGLDSVNGHVARNSLDAFAIPPWR